LHLGLPYAYKHSRKHKPNIATLSVFMAFHFGVLIYIRDFICSLSVTKATAINLMYSAEQEIQLV